MLLKNYKPILQLFLFALFVYVLHKLAFLILKVNFQNFYYSIEFLYLIFFGISALLYLILLVVKKKNFQIIGMAFLFGTFTQMLIGYLILRPVLENKTEVAIVEKSNFFITFILFLLFETLLTIRLLNEKH
ncbi:hypothetical protein GJU43_08550 [Flavobacterium sp. LC2016-23]|jgi:hypothetical protein|uniref:hypothetical protein n=1 Tax=Flavobacterium sp. LC2016-23 TaxID=2666330 RepID=UPI0012AEF1E4|nr:hypothetical protein [Flavobacterium sp. LC2016-23]MRX39321.1 hypothetical protein [Flavobacterium sp. LC2016-23]